MSVEVLSRVDAAALRAVMSTFAGGLEAHREVINRLNVYPVPDGDTGTNMALTVGSVVAEIEAAGSDLSATCRAISHGSLMGARGNSGVILSQILRGVAEVIERHDGADGAVLAEALATASTAAYAAVLKPVEGTILTVVRTSAEAATGAAQADADLRTVVEAARTAGGEALARTPDLLPVLADAGVVDAGGTGYLLLLDALLSVIDGRPMPAAAPDVETNRGASAAARGASDGAHRSGPAGRMGPGAGNLGASAGGVTSMSDLQYEVMFLLDAPDETIPAFKDVWAGVGDSIVVVGGDGLWNCHIHCDDIGAAIEAALDCGRPRNIRVTDLLDQVEEEKWVREAEPEPEIPAHAFEPVATAVVAVATGAGISRIFYSLGVQQIVTGGQTLNPSTAQLLEAVEAAPADTVVILPNNKNIIAVAEQVDSQSTKAVFVVPTHGIAEGFASLMSYDPEAPGPDNAKAMAEAAAAVVAGEITQAVRDSTCDLGPIREGHYIGLGRDGICSLAESLDEACTGLLDELVTDEHELVTIIEGEGSSSAATRHIQVWIEDHRPGVGTEVHHGGQPLYPYLFGVE